MRDGRSGSRSEESFAAFLAARRPAPGPELRAGARRTLRTWMPLLVLIMALTAQSTPAGLASRAILILAVLAEWIRLARPVAWLDRRWVLGLWLALLAFPLGHGLWRIHPLATVALVVYVAVVLAGARRSWRRRP